MNKPNLITQLFDVGCIKFGDFTMVSGLSSPIYIDLRLIMAQPTLLKQVALSYSGLIHNLVFDHLAAVPYAALPIGTALSLQINKPLIYPRKEVKKHGAKQAVEGVFSPLDKAIIIEDLVTKGGSVLGAIQILEEAGLTITDVAVLIDREQGGRERLLDRGYALHAHFTLSEVVRLLHDNKRISKDEASTVINSI